MRGSLTLACVGDDGFLPTSGGLDDNSQRFKASLMDDDIRMKQF